MITHAGCIGSQADEHAEFQAGIYGVTTPDL